MINSKYLDNLQVSPASDIFAFLTLLIVPTANTDMQQNMNFYLKRLRRKLLIPYNFTSLILAQQNQSMFNHNLKIQTSARADMMPPCLNLAR